MKKHSFTTPVLIRCFLSIRPISLFITYTFVCGEIQTIVSLRIFCLPLARHSFIFFSLLCFTTNWATELGTFLEMAIQGKRVPPQIPTPYSYIYITGNWLLRVTSFDPIKLLVKGIACMVFDFMITFQFPPYYNFAIAFFSIYYDYTFFAHSFHTFIVYFICPFISYINSVLYLSIHLRHFSCSLLIFLSWSV